MVITFKILAKALALQLRYILPKIIRENWFYQRLFYPGQFYCCMGRHGMGQMLGSDGPFHQIDFEKAYDQVEWLFI